MQNLPFDQSVPLFQPSGLNIEVHFYHNDELNLFCAESIYTFLSLQQIQKYIIPTKLVNIAGNALYETHAVECPAVRIGTAKNSVTLYGENNIICAMKEIIKHMRHQQLWSPVRSIKGIDDFLKPYERITKDIDASALTQILQDGIIIDNGSRVPFEIPPSWYFINGPAFSLVRRSVDVSKISSVMMRYTIEFNKFIQLLKTPDSDIPKFMESKEGKEFLKLYLDTQNETSIHNSIRLVNECINGVVSFPEIIKSGGSFLHHVPNMTIPAYAHPGLLKQIWQLSEVNYSQFIAGQPLHYTKMPMILDHVGRLNQQYRISKSKGGNNGVDAMNISNLTLEQQQALLYQRVHQATMEESNAAEADRVSSRPDMW